MTTAIPSPFKYLHCILNDSYKNMRICPIYKKLDICRQIVPLTDKLTAQRLMRHKDGRSTDNYYHAYGNHFLNVVQGLDNAVDLAKVKNEE